MEQQTPLICDVSVERVKQDTFRICWESRSDNRMVRIFAGTSPEGIDHTSPVAVVEGVNCAEVKNPDPQVRFYFEVVSEGSTGVIAAERLLSFEGVINFRDLGGYETTTGRRVKWGQVFRSGHLGKLTEKDRSLIRHLGIKTVFDFRTPGEVKAQPDLLPDDGTIQYYQLPIVHGEFDPVAAMARMQKGDISWLTQDFMVSRYIKKIDDFADLWSRFFNCLIDPERRPLVFHCTAGKDRAGACAALLLLALGVSEDTVIYDHGLSNVYNAHVLRQINERIRAMGIDPEKVKSYFTAPREAIVALVNHIRTTYGSAENYLVTKANMSEKQLTLLKQGLLD